MAGTVVFDMGGVLVPEGTRMQQLQQHLDNLVGPYDREMFQDAYWSTRNSYDCGVADRDFWLPVLAAAGAKSSVAPSVVDALASFDAQLNSTIAEEPRALLEELVEAGMTLAILSNAPLPMAEAVRARDWFAHFDVGIFSSEHAVMKPAERAYVLVDEALGVEKTQRQDVHFFDDRLVNVRGAHEHGWTSHLWTGVDDARTQLADDGLVAMKGS